MLTPTKETLMLPHEIREFSSYPKVRAFLEHHVSMQFGDVRQMLRLAPDQREKEVMAQLARPAFRRDLADIPLAFIPFDDLCEHCDALCKFGEDHSILKKIARTTTVAGNG